MGQKEGEIAHDTDSAINRMAWEGPTHILQTPRNPLTNQVAENTPPNPEDAAISIWKSEGGPPKPDIE